MNEDSRMAVKLWMEKQSMQDPLEIYNLEKKELVEIPNGYNLPLNDLVFMCVHMTHKYATRYADTKAYQCHSSAARTVLDIWRMCKYYQPNTDIFDVMHELYKLVMDKRLANWKCCILHQRVFYLKGYVGYIPHEDPCDEFGLHLEHYAEI